MSSPNIINIAIIIVKGADYYCIIYDVRKSDANGLLKNSIFDDRGYI